MNRNIHKQIPVQIKTEKIETDVETPYLDVHTTVDTSKVEHCIKSLTESYNAFKLESTIYFRSVKRLENILWLILTICLVSLLTLAYLVVR